MAVAARQTSVAVASRAPTRAPRRRQQQAQPRAVIGGVVWIAVIAALLAGVVALNVAVLGLNLQLDRLGREKVELRARNAQLAARLSSAAAPPRIGALARSRLGLVSAGPEQTTYVELGK